MAKPRRVSCVRLSQPSLPFAPLPPQTATTTPPLSGVAGWPPSRLQQLHRVSAKLRILVRRNPYAAGILEYHVDRLLAKEVA